MGILFQSVWGRLVARSECRLLMLGFGGAGKSTILSKLKLGEIITAIPTIGFNLETVDYKNISLTVWDLVAQDKMRAQWRNYYQNSQGLIFVVDSNDRNRVNDAREELHLMLKEAGLSNTALLVLANKKDLPNAMSAAEVTDQLGLNTISGRKWFLQRTSAISTTGDGLYEGLDWMSTTLSGKRM